MVWYLLLAFVLGAVAMFFWVTHYKAGALKIFVTGDPSEAPYVYPDFYKGAEFICRKKYVLFKVDVNRLPSQK